MGDGCWGTESPSLLIDLSPITQNLRRVATGPGAAPGGRALRDDAHGDARVVERPLHVRQAVRAAHIPLGHPAGDREPGAAHARSLHDLGPTLDDHPAMAAVRIVDAEPDARVAPDVPDPVCPLAADEREFTAVVFVPERGDVRIAV